MALNSKTIKAYYMQRFEVELLQYDDGAYCIRYRVNDNDDEFSERITDYHSAAYMFDIKVRDLEGH